MTSLRRVLRALLVGLALLAAPVRASELVQLPSRPGVTQPYLLLAPARPSAVVVLFTGGLGGLQLSATGEFGGGRGNFLVRSRARFVAQGFAVAVIDAPSDRQSPSYLSGFRQTAEHAADVRAVVADLRGRFGLPVVMVGTSAGTISVAAAALALRDGGGPDAIVLTSTILWNRPSLPSVSDMPVELLTVPVLLVHHEADGCRFCPPALLPALEARLKAPHQVRMYGGGRDTGDACEAWSHHGFNGLEDRVVADVAAWIGAAVGR